jgi:hypothetical protein
MLRDNRYKRIDGLRNKLQYARVVDRAYQLYSRSVGKDIFRYDRRVPLRGVRCNRCV